MRYLITWAFVAVGLLILFAGMRQNKWWLWMIGPVFVGAGMWYFFHGVR